MKSILCLLLSFALNLASAQYIGVKARYTETRLTDDFPNPPERENRLVLSFYEVTFNGNYVWTPVVLSNYDIWVYKGGLQYGNGSGGVVDSTGNNYPGYNYTAPKAVAYYNSLGLNYVDCDPGVATHYVVNGHELDCGFITVSYWDVDLGTGLPFEAFPAPNILLPYYDFSHPYYFLPGNVNFDWSGGLPGPPYNMYNFSCGGPVQLVMRGLLGADSSGVGEPLPVTFAFVRGEIQGTNTARIHWSNLTESDIDRYEIQQAIGNDPFVSLDTIAPKTNNGGRADYEFFTLQTDKIVFYRVKATENSGRIIYSPVVSLRLADTNEPGLNEPSLTVFPNPVTGNQFTFRLAQAPAGRYISAIITPDGKQVKQKMIEHPGNGDLVRQIELEGMMPGLYRLVVYSSAYRYTQSFVYGY